MNFDKPSGIERGDVVRVPKGTPFTSTHPRRRQGVTRHAQTIKVQHTLPAEVWTVGHRSYFVSDDGTVKDHFSFCQTESDLHHLCRYMGLPESDAGIEMIKQEALRNQVDHYGHGTSFDCRVQVAPERVCWPGSGGYWVDVPALACEKVS